MTTALRQPGSSFKPFTYAEAFNQGYTPATLILDVRTIFPNVPTPYSPENYDRRYHGPVLIRQALRGEPVRRFMNPQPVTVPASISVDELVNDFVYEHHYKMFPVVEAGRLAGCVTTHQVKGVPRDQWAQRTVGQIADECTEENTIAPGEDAIQAFSRMSRHHASRLMVVEDGRLQGILSLKDLLKFLSLKLELEGDGGQAPAAIRKARDFDPATKD
jgi:CBS domain-containing protein